MVNLNDIKAALAIINKPLKAYNKPVHLQVEPTKNCNLRCCFCSRENFVSKNSKENNMSIENFKYIFNETLPRRVTFAGAGEPFLNWETIDMIEYAHKGGAETIVTTNFTTGRSIAEKIVNSGLNSLRISIDAATSETYEKIRGRPFHQKILDGIKLVAEAKERLRSKTPDMGFEIVLNNDNLSEITDIVRLAKECGVGRVNFRPLGLVGIEKKKDVLMDGVTYDEYLKLLKNAKVIGEDLGVATNAKDVIQDMPVFWKRYTKDGTNFSPKCLYLWLQVFVSSEGEVTPCCALYMDDRVSMGNAFKEGFETVWNGKKYRKFRSHCKSRSMPYDSCKQCIPRDLSYIIKKVRFLKGRT
jgi:radical SAM protein with 4Fe4S-binding SPASM domain